MLTGVGGDELYLAAAPRPTAVLARAGPPPASLMSQVGLAPQLVRKAVMARRSMIAHSAAETETAAQAHDRTVRRRSRPPATIGG